MISKIKTLLFIAFLALSTISYASITCKCLDHTGQNSLIITLPKNSKFKNCSTLIHHKKNSKNKVEFNAHKTTENYSIKVGKIRIVSCSPYEQGSAK